MSIWMLEKKCLGILIELSKAFDSVNHQLLLARLEKYGGSSANYVMHADDTTLVISGITSGATQKLLVVQRWFQDNWLLLNTNKTKCISFCHENRDFDHNLLVKSLDSSIEQVKIPRHQFEVLLGGIFSQITSACPPLPG
nr:unnamed protein product [Callosobruchus analis]